MATALALGFAQLFDGAVLRILLKSVAVTMLVFAVVAVGGLWLVDWLLGRAGLEDAAFAGAGPLREALALLATIIGLWLGWRLVAMAVVQFYAEDVVRAVERRHYPTEASAARDIAFGQSLRHAGRSALRALLANLAALPVAAVLLVTGIGTFAVFWLVNALLLGRELQDMVWLRHQQGAADQAPISRGQRFALGGVVAAMLAVPFINLVAPVLGAATATHLVHRSARRS
ncbi:cysteine biosynthesis protein [Aurantiacibacter arachoides]|nr:cysteine biosynthesis protein [Aurantiacibacter arachoides]